MDLLSPIPAHDTQYPQVHAILHLEVNNEPDITQAHQKVNEPEPGRLILGTLLIAL